MCIIAIKDINAQFPSESRVRTMCRNNPDGFAMAYFTEEDGVRIYRTMDKNVFLDEYKKIVETHNPKETTMFIHARIGTHGSNCLANCHGWKDDTAGLCFAHNGILSIDNRDDLTDSETFFRDIFIPIFYVHGWVGGEKAINAIIGTSKFVFMDSLGRLIYYGNYTTDEEDGVLYSNFTYEDFGSYKYNSGCCLSRWGGSSKKESEKEKEIVNELYEKSKTFDESVWESEDYLTEYERYLLSGDRAWYDEIY